MKLESLAADSPEEIVQVESGQLTFGREPENTIVIDSDSISRCHACVFEVLGHWFLQDLESTNGTLVNGVRVNSGQFRLLRTGDLIQLANFPMRFLDPKGEATGTNSPPSLLVFSENRFETKFPLAIEGARFVIGGPEAHILIESESNEVPQLEICYCAQHLELSTGKARSPILVNGMSVSGVISLSDRDEVQVGNYIIVVNDENSAQTTKEERMFAALEAQKKLSTTPVQAHVSSREMISEGKDSDPYGRKIMNSRKFVFGTAPQTMDLNRTVAMSRQDTAYAIGEVSAAQRFSHTSRMSTVSDIEKKERTQFLFGICVFMVLVVTLIYFFVS